MQVDYVRVYKQGEGEPPGNPGGGGPADPSDPDEIIIGDEVRGLKKIGDDLLFYVNGAVFADLHYRINGGTQMNVAMHHDGGGNFTYPVNGLQQGDVVEYFFTYDPGQGALDTPWFTYIHGVSQ